jgi:ribonuclease HI
VFLASASGPAKRLAKPLGEATNNVAEYLALLYALQEALRAGYSSVLVRTDSELLARQMSGRYRVRDRSLQWLHGLAVHLQDGFEHCRIEHVPREQNRLADQLAGTAARAAAQYDTKSKRVVL